MAVLNPNEIFFTAFEPKQKNRFILFVDGFPAYIMKGVGAVNIEQGAVLLNHIYVERYVKVKQNGVPLNLHYLILLLLLELKLLWNGLDYTTNQ